MDNSALLVLADGTTFEGVAVGHRPESGVVAGEVVFNTALVGYQEILSTHDLDAGVRSALCQPGPVLVRVVTDYRKLHIRWIECVRKKYSKELTFDQKVRFLARIGSRALDGKPEMND